MAHRMTHGTRAGYERHRLAGEPACPACRKAHNAYQRMWAERQRRQAGTPERQPARCGTVAGYRRHRARREPACPACRAANAATHRAYRAANRERMNQRIRERRATDPLFRAAANAYARGYWAGRRKGRQ